MTKPEVIALYALSRKKMDDQFRTLLEHFDGDGYNVQIGGMLATTNVGTKETPKGILVFAWERGAEAIADILRQCNMAPNPEDPKDPTRN